MRGLEYTQYHDLKRTRNDPLIGHQDDFILHEYRSFSEKTSKLIYRNLFPDVYNCLECINRPLFSPCPHIFLEPMQCYQYRAFHRILSLSPACEVLFHYVNEWNLEHLA